MLKKKIKNLPISLQFGQMLGQHKTHGAQAVLRHWCSLVQAPVRSSSPHPCLRPFCAMQGGFAASQSVWSHPWALSGEESSLEVIFPIFFKSSCFPKYFRQFLLFSLFLFFMWRNCSPWSNPEVTVGLYIGHNFFSLVLLQQRWGGKTCAQPGLIPTLLSSPLHVDQRVHVQSST